MEQYTSEQALNGILNIITTVVNEHVQRQENAQSNKNQTGDLITELLGGVAAGSSQGVSLGSQVEALSKGMSALKDAGITDNDAKTVAGMISTLGDSIKSLEFTEANIDAVQSVAQALVLLGSIDEEIIDRINRLSRLKLNVAEALAEFINTLARVDGNVNNVVMQMRNIGHIDKDTIANIQSLGSIDVKIADSVIKFLKKLDMDDSTVSGINTTIQTIILLGQMNSGILDEIIDSDSFDINKAQAVVDFLKTLSIDENTINGINTMVQTVMMLNQIDQKTIDNIENLDNINYGGADKLIQFIEKLDFSKIDGMSEEKINSNIAQLQKVLSSINNVVNSQTSTLGAMFAPFKGRMIGKSIGNFIAAIVDSVPKEEINISVQGIGEILNVFSKFVEKDGKYSISKMKRIMNEKNGRQIGLFFKGLFDGIPFYDPDDEKRVSPDIKSVIEIIKLFSEFTTGQYIKIKIALTESNGKKIGKFFSAIFEEIPEKNSAGNLRAVTDFLKELSGIGAVGVLTLALLKPILSEKFGKAINGFVMAIIKDMTDERSKQIDSFTKSVKTLSQGMLILTGTVLALAGGIILLGAEAVVGSMLVMVGFTATMLYIVKKLSDSDKDIESGTKSLYNVAKAISILTANVLLLTVAANLMDFVDWIALAKMAVVFSMLTVITGIALKLSEKWNGKKDAVLSTMEGISLMLVAGAVAVGIATLVAANNSMEDIILGIGLVSGVMIGSYKLIEKLLKKTNKDMSKAMNNMWMIIGMLVVVSLAIKLLFVPIGKQIKEATLGTLVAGVIVGFLVGMTKWISTMDKRKIKDVNDTLVIMMGMLVVVALVGTFLLPMIGKQIEDVILGGVAVTLIMTVMIGMVKWLSTMDKKNLKETNMTLIAMTVMLVAISVVGAFLLPSIGEKFKDAMIGAVAVFLIIGAMVGMVKLISMIDEKQLNETYTTLAVMTVMLTAVSLVSALILPAIGDQFDKVIIGAIVVMAIIGLMIGMVKWLSKTDEKELHQTYLTLAVLTVMLVAVSLIANYLLPEIGKNWKDISIGAVVVLGIIGVMLLMVTLLSKIDDKKLHQTYLTMAVLTVMLVAVSLIANYMFPSIAEQWEDVLIGGAIVLGIIGLMTLIVLGLSKIDEKNLKWGTIALGVMTFILLGVSLITTELLIPIGKEWDAAAIGGAVVLSVISLMTGIVALAGKMSLKKIGKGVLAIAAAGALLAGIAWIINEMFIPIGENGENAAVGGAIVISTIGIMTIIISLAGKMDIKTIGKGVLAIAAVGALLWALGEMLPNYIDICVNMYDNAKEVAIGGLEIVATLAVWGLIMAVVGFLMDIGGAAFLAMGAAAIAGIAAIMWSLGEMLPSYIDICINMYDHAKETAVGGLEIVATLTVWGLIMTGIGALMAIGGAAFLAAGAAAITGIAAVLWTISEMLPNYIDLCKNVLDNKNAIIKGSDVVEQIITKFGLLITAVGALAMIPLVGVAMGAGAGIVTGLMAVIKAISEGLDPFISVLKKIKDNNITSSRIENFTKLFIGSGVKDEDPKSLYGSIKRICDAMNEIGLYSATMAGLISKNLTPIFKTLGMFIDVVGRICSMKYVSAWNNDGTPAEYETISPAMFKEAGTAISTTFGLFLTELGNGLDKLKDVSLAAIAKLAVGIKPVTEAVALFSNTILSVLSSKIECEWDKEGKPIKYRKFETAEFGQAATVISENFGLFLDILSTKIEPFAEKAGMIMNNLKDGIVPVIEACARLTESIMGVLKGSDYTVTENGKEIKKHIDFNPKAFQDAGKLVGQGFVDFITLIYDSFKAFDKEVDVQIAYTTTEGNSYAFGLVDTKKQVTKIRTERQTVNLVGKLLGNMSNISTIIDAAANFVDLIIKVSENLKKYDLAAAGGTIAGIVVDFVTSMTNSFSSAGYDAKIKTTMDNLEQLKNLVGKFSNVYNPLSKLFFDNKDKLVTHEQIDHLYDTVKYLVQEEKMASIKKITVNDISNVLPYVKKLVDIAKQLQKLTDVMKNADMLKACQQFIKDLEILTQSSLNKRVDGSRRMLGIFGQEVSKFTVTIEKSEKAVIKFVGTMKKGEDSFKRLDNAILKREKQRDESLKRLSEYIDKVAASIENMSEKINGLDKDKLVNTWAGVASLLRAAEESGRSMVPSTTQTQNTTTSTNQSNPNNIKDVSNTTTNTTNNHNYLGRQNSRQTMVEFRFQNTILNGFMTTHQM